MDQRLFAAPHDLSQRTTSFIASQRQGIHQTPLRHLIALIAKARVRCFARSIGNRSGKRAPWLEKTSFASNASGELSGQAPNPRLVARGQTTRSNDRTTEKDLKVQNRSSRRLSKSGPFRASSLSPSGPRPNALPLHNVRDRKTPKTARRRIENPHRRPFGLLHAERSRARRN
jgi:hypothetical protein